MDKNNSPRILIFSLITEDLGYCCPWRFFLLYPSTSLIAARLGVSSRAVRNARRRVVQGQGRCAKCTQYPEQV